MPLVAPLISESCTLGGFYSIATDAIHLTSTTFYVFFKSVSYVTQAFLYVLAKKSRQKNSSAEKTQGFSDPKLDVPVKLRACVGTSSNLF